MKAYRRWREKLKKIQKLAKPAKKSRTEAVLFRLPHSTINYLRGKIDDDAPSVPAAGRRIIEQAKRDDEAKQEASR